MSSRGGKNSNNNGGIPIGSKKMIQNLKEIVNCPEAEIYAMLKECNMDPNEAVNRLLTQDTFHEVKSKREKRKESKDTTESRSWTTSSTPSRGSRAGGERYVGRGGSESTKPAPAYRKESGSRTNNFSSTPLIAGSNTDRRTTAISDSTGNESKRLAPAAVDGYSAASQPSSGYQPTWGGVPGQVSMADIVKMGRPQSKVPSVANKSHHTVGEVHQEQRDYSSANDEWPSIEQPSAASQPAVSVSWPSIEQPPAASQPAVSVSWPSIEQPSAASQPAVSVSVSHPELSNMSFDRIDHQTQMDEAQEADDSVSNEDIGSLSSRKLQEDNADSASLYDNDLYGYQHQNHTFDNPQVEDVNVSVSSVAENLQQLNVKDDRALPSDMDGPSVVIPDHLQVQTADLSHLSFGSFGGVSFSGSLASAPVKTSLEDSSKDADSSSVGHLGTRAGEYYGDETLRNESDNNLFHRNNASPGNYELPAASQPESLKAETSDGHYSYPSSAAGYSYESAQQLNAAFSQPQTSSHMQNLAPYSNETVYTNSLQSNLLAANIHPGRESELSYSPFSTTQAMPTQYGNSISSISGSTTSMPEALKTVGFSSGAQPTQQMLSGTNVATGPTVPQHLAVHPYSQPTVPLGGPFANMISYPFMHQNYPYMPSAFQQAFPGNSTYHQSLAAMLPQYKNTVSASSLPQSASVPSGYGAFGNTNTIPGNFPINPPAAPSGTNLSYDDLLSSQYKDTNHLMSLQQNENSALWLHGHGSRTMPAVPANTYYGFQGQNRQQPSQSYGSLGGYPQHFYNSQAGISLDQQQQQQNLRDGSLAGPQVQPKQSQQQIWQNSY
ncbi:altered inheritance of mitochondria protein 3-like [Lycium ferocissimum]|uniref:altered inheritance of mitochondria protein 3-like n=1 Tax=Lycium ferocissimum TaxID=112874 RepID=UPI0028164265|nr:altered inheritance of mitochondria protein 3-like [Lycium ferocissimum]